MVLLYELTRGLAYLRIKHPLIDWYTIRLPVLFTAIICLAYAALPQKPDLLGSGAMLSDMLTIIATLPGFYFAALAAVATFDRPGMDVEIPFPAPTLRISVHGKSDDVALTKRMFLSYLFSYLTTVSLGLCCAILLANAAEPTLAAWTASWDNSSVTGMVADSLRVILVASVALPSSSLAVSTLHGIFFLTERLNQPH